jgi:hypothetical protein
LLAVDELSWFCSLLGRDQFEKEGGVAAIRASLFNLRTCCEGYRL